MADRPLTVRWYQDMNPPVCGEPPKSPESPGGDSADRDICVGSTDCGAATKFVKWNCWKPVCATSHQIKIARVDESANPVDG